MSATCGNVTCVRREHQVAVLIKCAADLAAEVDSLRAYAKRPQEDNERIDGIVERTYAACEQLQPDLRLGCKLAEGHADCMASECDKCGSAIWGKKDEVPA